MFPLQPGNELCFNISSDSSQQQNLRQDLILGDPQLLLYATTNDVTVLDKTKKSLRRKSMSMANNFDVIPSPRSDDNKKLMHRDIERQRRQEMAALYVSLRNLLPLEYIKGKRSISDHMNEAVKYIKFLNKKIKELDEKRNELIGMRNVPLQAGNSRTCCQSRGVQIRPSLGGIQIVFTTSGLKEQDQGLTLSKALQVLADAEISIVNCVSTRVHERVFHTIQTEVEDPNCLNLSELQKKLTQS
ncbi:transcription factor bHLH118-like [Mercurialis annua]|uniref:transcription factor bHLH118-like n=1 Tax=Mercurialis annua TaxID=3986 RepID=UPI002160E505|nr:transcription factor bHLH118-like [Mercurialis annua]